MNSYQDLLVNSITVLSESESNSTCSGAVVVNGGVGIKGNLYVGGCIVGNNISNGGNGNNSTVNFTSIGSNMLPTMSNCFNIGSSTKKWKNIYLSDTVFCNKLDVNSINSCNTISINNDVCINGNLNVTGTINGTNNCDNNSNNNCDNNCNNSYIFDNKTLTIGACSNDENDADGSGLIINIGTDSKHLLWYKGNNNQCRGFEFDDNLTIKGNLIIDGCIQSSTCNNNMNIISNDLIPLCTNTYNIGSSTKKWKNLYLADSLHIGVNHDFVNIDSINKMMTINGSSSSNNNSVYGNLLHISYNGCNNNDANILRLSHNSGIKGGSKILFDIDSINSCTIGANCINNNHTFVVSVYDSNTSVNNDIILVNNSLTNITNNTNIDKSLSVKNNIEYENNLIHSIETPDINCIQIDTTTTFSEISINQDYKELTFSYDCNNLKTGQIKYFIVTDITAPNCGCDSPHYKVLIDDLIGGTALILSSLGQSVGLVWTSQNKWLVFSGIACIVV